MGSSETHTASDRNIKKITARRIINSPRECSRQNIYCAKCEEYKIDESVQNLSHLKFFFSIFKENLEIDNKHNADKPQSYVNYIGFSSNVDRRVETIVSHSSERLISFGFTKNKRAYIFWCIYSFILIKYNHHSLFRLIFIFKGNQKTKIVGSSTKILKLVQFLILYSELLSSIYNSFSVFQHFKRVSNARQALTNIHNIQGHQRYI